MRLLKLFRSPAIAATFLVAAILPLQADTVYLFAGDRIPDASHQTSIHRFTFDSQTATTPLDVAVGGWGTQNIAPYQGMGINGLALGPDGDLYAVSNNLKNVLRIDGATGTVKKVIMSGLKAPECLAIDKAGNIYVADSGTVLRCRPDGRPMPGADQIGLTFATGGMLHTACGLAFGPNGDLFVAAQNLGRILRYDGRSGEYVGTFHEGDFQSPGAIAFGPDGHLYVASIGGPAFNAESGSVIKLNGTTGEFVSVFASEAKGAMGLAFGPNGNLFVSDYWTGKITQYDGKTGARVGVFAINAPGTSFYNLLFATQGSSATSHLKPLAGSLPSKSNTQ